MIFKPMFAVRENNQNIKQASYVNYEWETIEECRARLNEAWGKREYRIVESPRTISEFDVWFIEDNLIQYMPIKKKTKPL